MSTFLKAFITVVAVVAIAGGYFFPKVPAFFGSAAGSTFNNAFYAGVVVNLANAGANGTSTSILNNSGNTRYVTGTAVGCHGVGTSKTAYSGTGLASFTLTVATSSTAAPATLAEYAPVMHAFVVATSSSDYVMASSTTQTATSTTAAPWHSGEYMTFAFNATNTAVCTVGVNYIGS